MTHLLFAGHNYYPQGGIYDLVAKGTVDELKDFFLVNKDSIAGRSFIDNWGQIVNRDTLECEWNGVLRERDKEPVWKKGVCEYYLERLEDERDEV